MCNQSSNIPYLHLSRPIFHSNGLQVQKYKNKLRKSTNETLNLNIALKERGKPFQPTSTVTLHFFQHQSPP